MNTWTIIFSWLWDRVLGDPRISWHPTVLVGKGISFFEKRLLSPENSAVTKRVKGFIMMVLVLMIVTFVAGVYEWGVWQATNIWDLPEYFPWVFLGLGLSFAISTRSLGEAGNEIAELLKEGNLQEARKKVSWIVGRDTEQMNEEEIIRATVETVAENITDGVIAPLFYSAIGGLPLAWLYRGTNTLDSMVGYQDEKYQDFGRYSALWDDVMNYLPGRITGLLLLLAGLLVGLPVGNGIKMWKRDARNHPSPNGGIPESIVGGLLKIQLGGINYYKGIASNRAKMGDPEHQLHYEHIEKVVLLLKGTAFLGTFLLGGLSWLLYVGLK